MRGHLHYVGPVDLTQYYVQSYNFTDDERVVSAFTHGKAGAVISFVLSRRLMNQILTTFLPTGCICLVAFCTNYFHVRIH